MEKNLFPHGKGKKGKRLLPRVGTRNDQRMNNTYTRHKEKGATPPEREMA